MVPDPPRPGSDAAYVPRCDQSPKGPKPIAGLPAGSPIGRATAEEEEKSDNYVRSIVDEYLGLVEEGTAVPSCSQPPGGLIEEVMSVSSLAGSTRAKRGRAESDSSGDPDIIDRPHRGLKVLRSRVIGKIESDSDDRSSDQPIVLSNSPKHTRAPKNRRKKARVQKIKALDTSVNLDSDLANVVFTSCSGRLNLDEAADTGVDDLAGVASGWLDDMEIIRTKSKKISGRLSGCWKDRVLAMRSMIGILVERVKDSGDLAYLRRRNDELSVQLRTSRRGEARLQDSLKEADSKIEKLTSEIDSLRRRIGSASLEPERLPPPPVKGRMGTPGKLKEPRKERRPSVAESLVDQDNRLKMLSLYDEKIAKFEDLLNKMKADFYESMSSETHKLNTAVSSVAPSKRGVPRIIENIQLLPPRRTPEQHRQDTQQEPYSDLDTWTEITGRRNKRQVRIAAGANLTGSAGVAGGMADTGGRPQPLANQNRPRRKAPKNAAVAIKACADGPSYADIIKQARESVNLKELGISNTRMRRAANGGLLIEITGPEGAAKADSLASRLRDVIGSNAVVSRPVVKADLRISGFDESVLKDEVITMVTEFGECLASDVRVGPCRPMRNGLMTTWVQCPLSAALKVSRRGRANLGWSVARVELLRARPVQCFKCWHFGHVRNNCGSSSDRTGHCFRCGGADHTSYNCSKDPHCVVCADLNFNSNHRLGSSYCRAMTDEQQQVGNRGRGNYRYETNTN